ncbi:MAG: hypothetical protein BroJett029_22480 [Alphaproteobacteria bacterium]|nr:MAG: hypothetical protein BroJett029_22480 [Alphaproteobacteria bacterium]
MTTTLTEADVVRLLTDPSGETRAEMAGKIAQGLTVATLTDRERKLAIDIVRTMVKDAEVRVREALAQNLKSSDHLPHDLALVLARDVESVALPVLEFSNVFTDEDLIEIVRRSSGKKQVAVARRKRVSPPVADALIESRNGEAIATLVGNEGAELSEEALQRVIDSYGTEEAVQGGLVHRANLPPTVAERLVALVSENLREYLVTHHELPSAVATDLVLESRERATVNLLPPGAESADVQQLVYQLRVNGRLTPSLLLRSLCMGDMQLFEAGLAALAKAPLANARILIHDGGALGFKSLYMRAGLPERLYPAFRVAVDVWRETDFDGRERDRERHVCRMIERILTQFEDVGQENLDYLLKKLNQLAA